MAQPERVGVVDSGSGAKKADQFALVRRSILIETAGLSSGPTGLLQGLQDVLWQQHHVDHGITPWSAVSSAHDGRLAQVGLPGLCWPCVCPSPC